ncbi:hypothetical protein N824_04775 [Pedobacter sp. V48]|nr:hypothetical protein N824_04775 [Pedobacter sp. V48]
MIMADIIWNLIGGDKRKKREAPLTEPEVLGDRATNKQSPRLLREHSSLILLLLFEIS